MRSGRIEVSYNHTVLEFRDMDRNDLFVHHLRFSVHRLPFFHVFRVNAFVEFLKISFTRLECIEALHIGVVEGHG